MRFFSTAPTTATRLTRQLNPNLFSAGLPLVGVPSGHRVTPILGLRSVFSDWNVESLPAPITDAGIQRMIAARQLEESFYVVDLGKVVSQWRTWTNLLPRVLPFYAVKCNPDRAIVGTLAALGASFDCASSAEIDLVRSVGVDASRIIYANPVKLPSHIRHARAAGVNLMTFDAELELSKIARENPGAQVVLRIATDDSKSLCEFSSKFGASLEIAPRLIQTARTLNLNFVGVSFHVGSGCGDAAAYAKAVQDARSVFDMAERAGFKPHLLDVGGGFPGVANPGPISFDVIAKTLNAALDTHFPARPGLRIISEPGRFFTAASHTLATTIHGKRTMSEQTGTKKKQLYYVDDGIYHSFNCVYFDHQAPQPRPLLAPPPEMAGMMSYEPVADEHMMLDATRDMNATLLSKVFGPTCDGLDMIIDNVQLPDLHVGDWMVWPEMGSYTRASSSQFNGFVKDTQFYVCSDKAVLDVMGRL